MLQMVLAQINNNVRVLSNNFQHDNCQLWQPVAWQVLVSKVVEYRRGEVQVQRLREAKVWLDAAIKRDKEIKHEYRALQIRY